MVESTACGVGEAVANVGTNPVVGSTTFSFAAVDGGNTPGITSLVTSNRLCWCGSGSGGSCSSASEFVVDVTQGVMFSQGNGSRCPSARLVSPPPSYSQLPMPPLTHAGQANGAVY